MSVLAAYLLELALAKSTCICEAIPTFHASSLHLLPAICSFVLTDNVFL